jgi:hypothetical protein
VLHRDLRGGESCFSVTPQTFGVLGGVPTGNLDDPVYGMRDAKAGAGRPARTRRVASVSTVIVSASMTTA